MLKLVVIVVPFLLVLIPTESSDGIKLPTSAIKIKDGFKLYNAELENDVFSTPQQPRQKQQHQYDWAFSALDEAMKRRQKQRRSLLDDQAWKNPDDKIKSIAFKQQVDKEEIVHLKENKGQLQEFTNKFHPNPESSGHSISKRESAIMNRNVTSLSCSTPGNCVMRGKFCPHPDRSASLLANGTSPTSSYSNSKGQSIIPNRKVTSLPSCSTSGNCVMLGKFCPYPDRLKAFTQNNGTEGTVVKGTGVKGTEVKGDEEKGTDVKRTDIKGTYSNDIVCFSVQKSQRVPTSKRVHFREVLLNLGGSFISSKSSFTVPKSGIYEFNFNGHKTKTSKPLIITLRRNSYTAVNALSDLMNEYDFHNIISMRSLLKASKGEYIDLLHSQENLLHNRIKSNNVFQHSQFTGKLLFESDQTTTAVYFNAHKNAGFCKPSSVVPFEALTINVGGAFIQSKDHHRFISPVAGIYEFTVNGFRTRDHGRNENEELEIVLRHNLGRNVSRSFADSVNLQDDFGKNFRTPFSISSIVKLEKGDIMDLLLVRGCLYDDRNHLTRFTGKLLVEDSIDNQESSITAAYFNVQKNCSFSTADAVIPFEVEILNIGGAFDMTEHFFRAPRSGIYEFNAVGIKDRSQSTLRIALRLNNIPVTYVWADYVPELDFHTSFSLHYIMEVKKGDRVDLFNVGEGSTIFDDERKITHFTGKLLFPTKNIA